MEKHLMITGISNISWKDAIVKAIADASLTLDYLTGVTVLKQTAKINKDRIVEYYADIDVTFIVDRERK